MKAKRWILEEGHYEDEAPLPFYAEVLETVQTNPGQWSSLRVGIFDEEKNQIGEYIRNYSAYGESTFYPFKRNGQWYALYGKDYTATSLMTLPDCKEVGGQGRSAHGFCPVELYVPWDFLCNESFPFGFVSGCVWGDDTSWKVQYIDLDNLPNIAPEPRFGYVELPGNVPLHDAINIVDWHNGDEKAGYVFKDARIQIASTECYERNGALTSTPHYISALIQENGNVAADQFFDAEQLSKMAYKMDPDVAEDVAERMDRWAAELRKYVEKQNASTQQ